MKYDISGIILAGGKNSRLPGEKKPLRKVGDRMILESIFTIFQSLFKETILVVNDPKDFVKWDMNIVTDIIPSGCALAGIHAGLFYASYPYAYVTASDTPFVSASVIQYIINRIEKRYEVIIPKTKDGLETLFAVYSKDCIPFIEKNLSKNIYMIKKFFRPDKVKEILVDEFKHLDPELRFIFNVNTPEDLEKANKMA